MSTLREAAEKALMALTFAEESGRHWPMAVKMARNAAIEALRAALSAAPAPQPAGGEPQPEAQQEQAGERKPLTDEQIDRHSIAAVDCPPSSTVILVSSLRRLLGITATKGER